MSVWLQLHVTITDQISMKIFTKDVSSEVWKYQLSDPDLGIFGILQHRKR